MKKNYRDKVTFLLERKGFVQLISIWLTALNIPVTDHGICKPTPAVQLVILGCTGTAGELQPWLTLGKFVAWNIMATNSVVTTDQVSTKVDTEIVTDVSMFDIIYYWIIIQNLDKRTTSVVFSMKIWNVYLFH